MSPAVTWYPPAAAAMAVTGWFRKKATLLAAAFSARATVYRKGRRSPSPGEEPADAPPPGGAWPGAAPGPGVPAPGDPLASPWAFRRRRVARSVSSKATRIFPVFRKGTSSSRHRSGKPWFPATQSLAIKLPGRLLKPAWTTAELRPLVPAATSASFSTRAMDSRYRASSRAMAQPTAPPPTMSTSKDWFARFKNLPSLLPPYHSTGGRRSQGTGGQKSPGGMEPPGQGR